MHLKACSLVFWLLAAMLGFFALMFRADSDKELSLGRKVDVAVGVLFASAYLLARLPAPPAKKRAWKYRTALGMVFVWVGTSGTLMFFHTFVAYVRFPGPQTVTLERVSMVHHALRNSMRDCGSAPTEDQGLRALCENPGVKGWSGPYLQTASQIDGWGNALRYGVRDGRMRVWSCGPDGVSGTDDDIIGEETAGAS
ncbi:MAG: type II secretion system protein GspG [Planctomycetes bacterium]|nr:type II secretion system protein GspG [Planctomycetota bacterium]